MLSKIVSILIFAAPGVIIGAQLGVNLAQKLKEEFTKKFLFALFLIIGILSFIKLI